MSPKRYLLRRRMAFVRRALRAAEPDAVTVTDVATRYGFGQLGALPSGTGGYLENFRPTHYRGVPWSSGVLAKSA